MPLAASRDPSQHPTVTVVTDIDGGSDTSDLPLLADIFALGDTRCERSPDISCEVLTTPGPVDRAGKECFYVGDYEDSINPATTAATGVQLGVS